MFLLGVGEILEEWTHKKSVGDLARSMALNTEKVWLKSGEQEVFVDSKKIEEGDHVIVRMGNIIPFDGVVLDGEGMVNQSSLTGEPLPVLKAAGGYLYAGSVLEEGELVFAVKKVGGSSRYEKIVEMIEESEKLKSSVEGKAERICRQIGSCYFCRNSPYMAFNKKYHESSCSTYGRLFLCIKVYHAHYRFIGNPSGRGL